MTYQVLARKWRPRSFSEMAGQSHVLKTLIHSLDSDRLHHAYLFTGTRGVGKTTIARILAKCLNCEQGVTSKPCGECSACNEIDEGRFIDLIEVDAASRTKVEDTRELLDNVQYAPTRGRYKVYLIDEVHMLSGHSFNALLKTLEEPPPHVKFLLATTDPQKLPVTVLSRCLQFNLKNLSPEQIVEHMTHILKSEAIDYEDTALWLLGRAARGSVRDSLTLLDQAIAFGQGSINEQDVSNLLGTIDQNVVKKLLDALIAGSGEELIGIVREAAEMNPDFSSVLDELLSYLHRVAIGQAIPEAIDNSQGDKKAVLEHAGSLPAETLQLFYQIALKGREDLPLSLDARSGFEMVLLRMLAFKPAGSGLEVVVAGDADDGTDESQLKKKPESLTGDEKVTSPGKEPGTAVDAPLQAAAEHNAPAWTAELPPRLKEPVTVRNAPPQKEETAAVRPDPLRASDDEAVTGSAMPANDSTREKETFAPHPGDAGSPAPPAQASDSPSVPLSEPEQNKLALDQLTGEHWVSLFEQLNLTGITGNIAANTLLEVVDGNQLAFLLDETKSALLNDQQTRRIEEALSRYFSTDIRIGFTLALLEEHHQETPARLYRRLAFERQQKAVSSFNSDAGVQEIVERFNGSVLTESIVPLTPENVKTR